jgi:tetratricopeptide (TPR) repeat protein
MRRSEACAWTAALAAGLTLLGAATTAVPAAESSAAGAGLAAVFGPASAALGNAALGLGGNPALLGMTERTTVAAGFGLDTGDTGRARFDAVWPRLGTNAWGAGIVRRAALAGEPAVRARTDWCFAYARGAGTHWLGGAMLRLRNDAVRDATATSFGLDLGAHWQARSGRLESGLCVRNALQPEADGSTARAARGVDLGVAYTLPLGSAWRMSTAAGIAATHAASSSGWLASRLTWRRGLELAVGGNAAAQQCGAGVQIGALRCEYVYATADAPRHAFVVRTALGPTRDARRAAAAARDAEVLAARVDTALEESRTQAIARWMASADSALAASDFVPAAERYRSALLWNPELDAARDGLRHAERGALLQRVDSLFARHDSRGAALALEQAAQLFPADTVVVARWQAARHAMDLADRSRNEATSQVRLGLDAYATQRFAAAGRAFEAALQLDPANAIAAEFLQRARSARAKQVREAVTLARTRLRKHDPEGARGALQVLVDDGPPPAAAAQLLAQAERVLERQAQDRRLADARREQESVREDRTAPPPAALPQLTTAFDQGMQLYRAGDLSSAMRAWEAVAHRAPHFGEVDQYLLRVYRVVGLENYTEGRLQDAIDIWNKAIRLEPDNTQVRRYLEQANAKLQRAQGAREPR